MCVYTALSDLVFSVYMQWQSHSSSGLVRQEEQSPERPRGEVTSTDQLIDCSGEGHAF